VLERAAHNHGGDHILYIAARLDDDGATLNVDDHTYFDVLPNDGVDFDTDNDLAPVQRALDDLVRAALDFGASGSNDIWAKGVDNYQLHNLHHDDKARAIAALNATLDFAKAVATARHRVRQP
jgi:hypothetical protein